MNQESLQNNGLPPAHDRMLTTCFLAALFHGIVILGVTFTASHGAASDREAPALEVVLVNDQIPKAASNPNAHYIAQRTQLGAGSARGDDRTLIPDSSLVAADQAGSKDAAGLEQSPRSGEASGTDDLVATHARVPKILYFAAQSGAQTDPRTAQLLENKPNLAMTPNDDGIELHLRGAARDQLWVAADTREADVAVYLDGWRRKIERVGTLHFPDAARRKNLSGTPVIEVTIGADGRLLKTVVRRSSGHAEIDDAAMRILKLAAPYDPFSSELGAHHDEIRIAYEWQFLGGAGQGSSVFYGEPTPPHATP